MPEGPIALEPTCRSAQGLRAERVETLSSGALLGHEVSLAQDAKVLGNGGSRLREVRRERAHGGGTRAEAVEERPPRGIGDGSEDVGVGSCSRHNR